MSIDLKIQNLCDHVVNWEIGQMLSDLRSIFFPKPIASTASLSVRINNVVIDPSRYSVKVKEDVLSEDKPFYVIVKYNIKDYQPLVEAQYTTISTFCRKCRGINYVDDFEYINGKDFRTCKDEELLLQLMEKYIITVIGSNPFHSWVGTDFISMIGGKITDPEILTTRMKEQCSNAIEKLKSVQKQLQATGREMTPGELFGDLISMSVAEGADPSIYTVTVRFTSQSGKQLEYSQRVKLGTTHQRIAFS